MYNPTIDRHDYQLSHVFFEEMFFKHNIEK